VLFAFVRIHGRFQALLIEKGNNIMYRTVYDLTREELDELKDALFWSDETDEEILEGIDYSWQIPDEAVLRHFDGISFVDEDFFCNIQDDNYENCGAVYA
jgi:hypothetical protein